ncbi:hypothetical protein MRY87_10905, partial [bacterium]|nr:hypothetical protein [bacterium]
EGAFFIARRASDRDGGSQDILGTITEGEYTDFVTQGCRMEELPGQPKELVGKALGDCNRTYATAPAALCDQPDVICEQEFAGFCGGDGGDTPSHSALQQVAEAHFNSRVQTLYPSAKFGCTGENCVRFAPPTGYDPEDPEGLSAWEGSIEVPLLSANLIQMFSGESVRLFGPHRVSFTVGSQQERTFETEHTR